MGYTKLSDENKIELVRCAVCDFTKYATTRNMSRQGAECSITELLEHMLGRRPTIAEVNSILG